MIAKIAYLTSPAPNRFVLHFQPEGEQSLIHIEISKGHLSNIIIDGASLALREQYSNRVPPLQHEEAHERAIHRS